MKNFPNHKNFLLPPMERAIPALLDDLQDRGLLKDTLNVMTCKFGRVPKITKVPLPGYEHWDALQSVFPAGGGVQKERGIGSSDKID